MLGDTPFRAVRAPLWDLDARIAVLDAHSVTLQVVSPTPIMLTYWAEPKAALDFARAVNDSLAAHVARLAWPARRPGHGAAAGSRARGARAAQTRDRAGPSPGSRSAPARPTENSTTPSWHRSSARRPELDTSLFIHPLDGGGNAIRRGGQPYDFGLGMLTDTAMAATALVCGGVLDRHPGLRIGLAHGCGTLAWAAPRLKLGTRLGERPELYDTFDETISRLWVDTLVFDPEHLRLLVRRFGAEHVMTGTDFPSSPGSSRALDDLSTPPSRSGRLIGGRPTRSWADNVRTFLGAPAVLSANSVTGSVLSVTTGQRQERARDGAGRQWSSS